VVSTACLTTRYTHGSKEGCQKLGAVLLNASMPCNTGRKDRCLHTAVLYHSHVSRITHFLLTPSNNRYM
jgi:hypothetical protein